MNLLLSVASITHAVCTCILAFRVAKKLFVALLKKLTDKKGIKKKKVNSEGRPPRAGVCSEVSAWFSSPLSLSAHGGLLGLPKSKYRLSVFRMLSVGLDLALYVTVH